MVPFKCNFTHAHVYWLVRTCVQIYVSLRVMEHSRVSLTVHACYTKGCTHVLHKGLYTRVTQRAVHACDTKGCTRVRCSSRYIRRYIHVCYSRVAYVQQTEPQKDRRMQFCITTSFLYRALTYSSDIISSYSELASVVIKILTSLEMCNFSLLCFKKERWLLWMGWIHKQVRNIL